MKQNIIVIDDFHHNPEEVRQFALNAGYPEPGDGYTYPCKNSAKNYYPPELHEKFEYILDEKLIPAEPNGYFRLSLERDRFKKNISSGIAYVYSTFNNTIISIADENGNVISWSSAGAKGF